MRDLTLNFGESVKNIAEIGERPEKPFRNIPPVVEIKQTSWCTWDIQLVHRFIAWDPIWHIGTLKSAQRRADRMLRRYVRLEFGRQSKVITVSSDEYEKAEQTRKALSELKDPEAGWDQEFNQLSGENR